MIQIYSMLFAKMSPDPNCAKSSFISQAFDHKNILTF